MHAFAPRSTHWGHTAWAIGSPASCTGPATSRHTANATRVSGYPTLSRLCSSSSSIHSAGTPALRAAFIRSRSAASSPFAMAAATRTSAMVCGSSVAPARPAFPPALIVPLPTPHVTIFSFHQSSIYPQLPDHVPARVARGRDEQGLRDRLEPQLAQHGRHGQGGRRAVAVLDLEGEPQPFPGEQGAVNPL